MNMTQLKALLLEDSKSDALLLVREMKRGGFEVDYEQVETAVDLKTALEDKYWDVILSDHTMPSFSAPEALDIVRRQKNLDTPFIIVSGTISEDIAVEAMKAGANDYFSKNKLIRLVPAIERELQKVEERRQRHLAERQLQATEERFAKAFNASPVAIAIARLSDGRTLSVNPRFVDVFGHKQIDVIGKNGTELNLWDDSEQRLALLERLRRHETLRSVEVTLRRADGETIHALLSAEVIELNEESCILSFIQDVTELKQREARIHRANKRIKLLQDIAVTANEATDIEPVLQFTVEAICAHTGWEVGHVFLEGQDGKAALKSMPIWYLSDQEEFDEFRRVSEASYATHTEGLIHKVWETQTTQWLEDVSSSPEFVRREIAKKCGLRGGYAIPVLANNQTVGVLEFFSRQRPDNIARDVIEISIHIGSQVGRTIERQWATDKLQQYTERLELLREVDQAILNSVHPRVIADSTLRQLKQLIPFYGVSILQFDYENNQATFLAINMDGESGYEVGDAIPMEAVPTIETLLETLRGKRPYIVHDIQTSAELLDIEQAAAGFGIRSYLVTPLFSGDTLLGALSLFSDEPNIFSSETVDIVMEVAAHLAVAIQNADLYQQVQQYAQGLEQRVEARTVELQHQKERVETILRSSEDAILLLEQGGLILQANYSFCAIFGWDKREVVGKRFADAAHVSETGLLEQALRHMKEMRIPQRIELTVHKPNGLPFKVDVMLSPVKDGEEGRELICSLRDITARKQIEEELRNALKKEQELNELKTSFTSMVSHEFRTPLSIIKVSTETLIAFYDRLDDKRRAEKLRVIDQQIDRLTKLMDDVLLLGRGEQRGLSFNPAFIDLISLASAIIEEVETTYSESREVDFKYDEACDDVNVDKHLFLHIFQNLLTNAFKYSPAKSTITIRLNCSKEVMTLFVKDEGIGMPAEFQQSLFKMFHRAKNVEEEFAGTGLGLAIVKRAVDTHGGTIEVDSIEGKGTSVLVTLPTTTQ